MSLAHAESVGLWPVADRPASGGGSVAVSCGDPDDRVASLLARLEICGDRPTWLPPVDEQTSGAALR